jgi:glycosyltransferase involved in cell wall biosynthesis
VQAPFLSCKKEQGSIRCIFVSRIVPIKNLFYILRVLKDVKQQVFFSVVGPVENETYWNECKAVIKQLQENITVQYVGAKNNGEITELIKQHHLFVLPTTGENFGHAIIESLLAGRPVLISDQTPWLNLAVDNAGWDLPLDKPELFVEKIEQMAATDQEAYDRYAMAAWQYAHAYIQDPSLTTAYQTLFE